MDKEKEIDLVYKLLVNNSSNLFDVNEMDEPINDAVWDAVASFITNLINNSIRYKRRFYA